jgi:hypothetical protein
MKYINYTALFLIIIILFIILTFINIFLIFIYKVENLLFYKKIY